MAYENFFFGLSSHFVPWIGIVERRNLDDFKIGRCKVRAFGHHSGDTSEMPTDQLPDAYPLEPLTGTFWSTAKEGDTVFGYFLDEKKQSMLIVGKLPAAFQREVSHPEGSGYKDARPKESLAGFPRQYFASYSYSMNGVQATELESARQYPPYGEGRASIPFLSRADISAIPNQISPTTKKSQAGSTRYNTATGKTWVEPPTPWAAVYPFNHAYESESLHVMEFDDTPGAERVSLHHRVGSGFEYFPDGTVVYKNVKDGYEVTLGNKKVGVSGDCDIEVKGNHTLLVDGDFTMHVSGNYFLSVDGESKTLIRGNETKNIGADSMTSVEGQDVLSASGALFLKGSPVHENSSSTPDVPELQDVDLPSAPANPVSSTNQESLIKATGSPVAPNDDATDIKGQLSPNALTPTPIACPLVKDSQTLFESSDVRYRMQLSKYFQLADMTIRCIYPHGIVSQAGLKLDDIVCNLASLCQDVLDPVFAQFPGATINSGFRQGSGKSSHDLGQAVDLQWSSIGPGSLSKYLDIATWISENVPFDQIILEHGTTCWIHVSLAKNGPNRKQLLTMKDGQYIPGLSMMGRT